ncbi:MAG TPA: hypothetical protein VFK94_03340, partial [Patescibacteria group bacterium]|nr:hypothetical protein [Patescibacteria group bacterium]
MDVIEIQHLPVTQGRQVLRSTDWSTLGIPSVSPVLTTRWQAQFKEKFLDPGESQKFLKEILDYVQTLNGITTQRAIYYAIRGRHPEWTYKGEPLGDGFYEHLVMWLMEKIQLMTGMTMQAMGIWAAPRGYITGDGTIQTATRGRAPLNAKPALGFDMADTGMLLATHAKKVIHFEKDAGLESLTSGSFPRFVEAVFSTSQGQLTEAANKFLRECENRGMALYSVHDGDPSGIQMQLLYGMATKNNCYMPSEFYPTLVKPLGFYPSIGDALGLPPEDVTDKEDKIFDNLLDLLEGKQKNFPELRRFGLVHEVDVIVTERKKWEFQALNAIHETAPKFYLLEGLRVHGDEIKHVPSAPSIKASVVEAARSTATQAADRAVEALASDLLASAVPTLVEALKGALSTELEIFRLEVEKALRKLEAVDNEAFREYVKRQLVASPEKYAAQIINAMGGVVLSAVFNPKASISLSYEMEEVTSTMRVDVSPPRTDLPYTTKTALVDAIEKEIVKDAKTRTKIQSLIRGALEDRFGIPE